jgi:YVTN family beta-propeller protein
MKSSGRLLVTSAAAAIMTIIVLSLCIPMAFVANASSIDRSNIPIGDKANGFSPFDVVINHPTNTVYTISPDSNTVAVINASTNQLTHTISVGKLPVRLGINENTGFVYVANGASGTVSIISGTTNKIEKTLNVTDGDGFYGIGGIAVNERTNKVYVLVNNYLAEPAHASILVIDGLRNSIEQEFKVADLRWDYDVGDNARGIAVNSKTNTIYVTTIFGSLHVIDGSNNKILTSMAVGRMPTEVEINEETNRIYISDFGSQLLFIVDGSTNRITETVWIGHSPQGIAVDELTNTIYVAGPGFVIVNGSSNQVEARIEIDGFPNGVALDHNSKSVYVANWMSHSIVVVAAGGHENSGSVVASTSLRQNTTSGNYTVELDTEFTTPGKVTLLISFFDESGLPLDSTDYDLVIRNASNGEMIQQIDNQIASGVGRHEIDYENGKGILIDVVIKPYIEAPLETVTFEIVAVPEFSAVQVLVSGVAVLAVVAAVYRVRKTAL